ncbi:MAG: hypothetical protein CL411_00775 [Acidimicrobiaceae bacterium]|nr:hypothetical protein [Acidimicrobiaceae bacterium]
MLFQNLGHPVGHASPYFAHTAGCINNEYDIVAIDQNTAGLVIWIRRVWGCGPSNFDLFNLPFQSGDLLLFLRVAGLFGGKLLAQLVKLLLPFLCIVLAGGLC